MLESLRDALAILFPVECAGCAAPDRALCRGCLDALAPAVERRESAGVPVYTALVYADRVRRVILNFKENDRTDAASALARPLAYAVAAALCAHPTAVAALVPTSRSSYRRRGYDPVRLLAGRAGLHPERVLWPTRATGAQKTLGVGERATNLLGSLRARHELTGREFVIVDDVLTSGATLAEASRAIREGGGRVVAAATLAFTPRLLPFRDNAEREGLRWG